MRRVPGGVIGCGIVILGDLLRVEEGRVTSSLARKESQQQQQHITLAVLRLRFVALLLREQRARSVSLFSDVLAWCQFFMELHDVMSTR